MNETLFNTTSFINTFSDIDPKCVGDYISVALGVLLFISEALPFYKRNCKYDIDVVDVDGQVKPIERQPSILQNSNGVLDLAKTFLINFNKK